MKVVLTPSRAGVAEHRLCPNDHCQIYPVRDAARRVSVRLRCEADRVARLTAIHPANIKESAIDRDHDAAQRLHSTHLSRPQRLSLVWDQ